MADEPFRYSEKNRLLIAACKDPRLLRTDLAVFGVIVEHAKKETGKSFPGVATIVSESGVPKTTTLRAIARLEGCGWMAINRRFGAGSIYSLTGPVHGASPAGGTGATWNATGAIQGLRTGPAHGAEPVPPTGHKQKKAIEQVIEQGATGPIAPPVDGFSAFWQAYPNKAAKAKAESIWRTQKLDRVADQVMADLVARAEDPGQWTDPKYIPHATTYLNQRRWQDEWTRAKPGPAALGVADDFRNVIYIGTPPEDIPEYLRRSRG